MNRAVFLDRDGVLDELVFYPSSNEWEAPRTLDDLVMIDGIAEPLRRFVEAGWLLFIVTNQPSYAKGKTTMEDTQAVHAAVVAQLGVPITQSYICLHHPEAIVTELRIACECRKPGTQSLRDAARDFNVDLSKSWMIGDQDSDLLCGRAAGCRVALLENPRSADKRGEVDPDLRVSNLTAFGGLALGCEPAE